MFNRNIRKSPIVKLLNCCTSTGWDDFMEFEMERIGPMVVQLQSPQAFGCLTGMSGKYIQWANCVPLHIYGSMWFHRIWDEKNQSSGRGVTQEFGCPKEMSERDWWVNVLTVAHLQAKTDPQKLRWSKSIQQLGCYSVCNMDNEYFMTTLTFIQRVNGQ